MADERTREFLRSPQFLRLYATRLISAVADGIFQAALASYVLFNPQNATTPAKTAAAFAALLLPYSVAGPFAGVFLDRWSRQRVLVVGNLVKAALVLCVGAVVVAGHDGLALFVTAVAALGVNRLFLSALSASLPHVVAEQELVGANAVATTSGSIATIGGAAIGGLVRLAFGSGSGVICGIVAIAGVVYATSAAMATTMGRDLLGPAAHGRTPSGATPSRTPSGATGAASLRHDLAAVVIDLGAAAMHLARRRRAAIALGTISAHRFLYGVATLTIVLLERNYFASQRNVTSGLLGLGAVLGLSGAGIVVGALLTPWAGSRIGKTAWITLLLAAAAAAIAVFGLPFRQPLLVVGAFVLGVSAQGVKICVDTTVQEDVDDDYRGRAFAVYDMLFNATYVGAAAVAATVLPKSGRSFAVMLALAVGYAAASAGFAWLSTRVSAARAAALPLGLPGGGSRPVGTSWQ